MSASTSRSDVRSEARRVTDIAYVPTSTDLAVRAALASIYSGAGLVEARALLDQLEDRGYEIRPKAGRG